MTDKIRLNPVSFFAKRDNLKRAGEGDMTVYYKSDDNGFDVRFYFYSLVFRTLITINNVKELLISKEFINKLDVLSDEVMMKLVEQSMLRHNGLIVESFDDDTLIIPITNIPPVMEKLKKDSTETIKDNAKE